MLVKFLSQVVYNYNIAVHSVTEKSSFELFYGRKGFNTVLSSFNHDTEECEDEVEYDNEMTSNFVGTENNKEEYVRGNEVDVVRNKKYLTRMDKKAVHNSFCELKSEI
jgi:hypothetical protein